MARNSAVIASDRDTKSRKRDKQPEIGTGGFSARYASRLADLDLRDAQVSRSSGIPTSTLSRYRNGGSPRAEHIFPLADALKCSARWLIAGTPGSNPLEVATDADWVELLEFDLKNVHAGGKGAATGRSSFRRDWLNRAFGTDKGLWSTALPSDYPAAGLTEGDEVICRNVTKEELRERQLCIWWAPLLNKLMIARYSVIDRGGNALLTREGEEYWADPHLVEADDIVPIGRIVGRPLSPIR